MEHHRVKLAFVLESIAHANDLWEACRPKQGREILNYHERLFCRQWMELFAGAGTHLFQDLVGIGKTALPDAIAEKHKTTLEKLSAGYAAHRKRERKAKLVNPVIFADGAPEAEL